MSTIPPGMWERPEDYQDEVAVEIEEDERKHRHGPGCGHEAVEHGDHMDYMHEGHRHWWNRDHWEKH